MKSYIIRDLEKHEIFNTIEVLLLSFGRLTYDGINEEVKLWEVLINNNIAKYLIAVEDGKIFGVGGVFIYQKVASIGYMGVLEQYRGNGIGTDLFNKLMQIAVKSGCNTVILYASNLGEPIYKKYGFRGMYSTTLYHLKEKISQIPIKNKNIENLKIVPDWIIDLDNKTIGFDRSNYLKLRAELGHKFIAVENEGYAIISKVMSNIRIGPLIATNTDSALQIIKKGISMGANNIIIPKHASLRLTMPILRQIIGNKESPNLKMIYGDPITGQIENLYAIGTFARG